MSLKQIQMFGHKRICDDTFTYFEVVLLKRQLQFDSFNFKINSIIYFKMATTHFV